mmetsp:Transcript_15292/g.21817  ORF Transcript_15292/g.21817 Transcript_15292/m.21817 type:complete len:187 (+) Transcript_15292:91-651(+)|eukprot:CAMPEP_0184869106 /NCGR_PEP_ID=MMETSP0580-20130426/32886_1 /TAXON_ID=1118495 /ORGANISM="Dactyliosolen fragilissimus" /LENGTH=186 /DNA_ID=CAMNT_0027370375 /DNA_START=58 /DNA_END=618 /DNA_ORIENTATION=+
MMMIRYNNNNNNNRDHCLVLFLCLVLALIIPSSHGVSVSPPPALVQDTVESIRESLGNALKPVKVKYDSLPPKGKFATSAVIGFVSSKAAVGTTVKVLKIAGATFLVSELLNYAGVYDNIDDKIVENSEFVQKAKTVVLSKVNHCRLMMREHLTMDKARLAFERAMKKDKMGTMGCTTGAVAALVW